MEFMMRNTIPVLVALLVTILHLTVRAQSGPEDPQALADRALQALYEPGGLTAEQAVAQALTTSPDLKRARAAVLGARGGAKQAIAALVPQLDLSASYARLSRITNSGLSTEGQDQIDMLVSQVTDPAAQMLFSGITSFSFPVILDRYGLQAQLSYPLTAAFTEVLPTFKSAKLDKEAAKAQHDAERAFVALSAEQAFYEYARAKAAKLVADASLEESQAQQGRMRSLVKAGTAAQVDLLRVDAQVAAAEVALAQADLGLAVAKRSLQSLLHSDEPVSVGEDLSRPVTGWPEGDAGALEERAFSERPDVFALKRFIMAREKGVRAAKGAAYPEVLLQGTTNYANPNDRVIPQVKRFKNTWEVGAVLRWSPNETATARGQKDRANAELMQAEADLTQLLDGIKIEVAQGYHGLAAAKAALKSAVVGHAAARESYRVRTLQLDAGIVNTTDLLEAQSDLNRARLELVASAVGLRIAKASLKRAVGEVPH